MNPNARSARIGNVGLTAYGALTIAERVLDLIGSIAIAQGWYGFAGFLLRSHWGVTIPLLIATLAVAWLGKRSALFAIASATCGSLALVSSLLRVGHFAPVLWGLARLLALAILFVELRRRGSPSLFRSLPTLASAGAGTLLLLSTLTWLDPTLAAPLGSFKSLLLMLTDAGVGLSFLALGMLGRDAVASQDTSSSTLALASTLSREPPTDDTSRWPGLGTGLALAFRQELVVLLIFVSVIISRLVFTAGGVVIAAYMTLVVVLAAMRWLSGEGFRFPPFKRLVLENLVFGVIALAANGFYNLVFRDRPVATDSSLDQLGLGVGVVFANFALGYLKRRAARGPRIAFFRSFDASVSRFTASESAPTLAGFGKLDIVNDDVVDALASSPLFGINRLQMTPVSEQHFFTTATWHNGVGQIIDAAELFVFDVTTYTPGVAWELERCLAKPGGRFLFIAKTSRAATDASLPSSQRSRWGSFNRPIPYSETYAGRVMFRCRLAEALGIGSPALHYDSPLVEGSTQLNEGRQVSDNHPR